MTVWGVVENIVSDMLFAGLVVLGAWLWLIATQRRALISFFGVSESKRIVIYLSNIRVSPFGSLGASGKKFSFNGQAVAYGETQAASKIAHLFSFAIPSLAAMSERIGRLLLSDVRVDTVISPTNKTEIDMEAPFVSLGTPAYSNASDYIETLAKGIARVRLGALSIDELKPYQAGTGPTVASSTDEVVYDSDRLGDALPSGSGGSADPYPFLSVRMSTPVPFPNRDEPRRSESSAIVIRDLAPITDTSYAFVERLWDDGHNRNVFYIAGLSELGTKGAAFFLASQWFILHRRYPHNQAFLVLLRIDPQNYLKWSIIAERSIVN